VVLVVIDTLRGDRLGCTGYADARTPNLDALAARGLLFTAARTPVPVTLPAVSSLLTGRYPVHHGVRDNDRFVLADSVRTLPERFRAAGWRTGAVLGSAILAADRGLARGFEVYDDRFAGRYPCYTPDLDQLADQYGSTRRRGNVVTDRALEVLHGFGKDRFFLFVHYFDVHDPYDPPPEYRDLHPGRPYDAGVSVADHEVGRLLDALAGRDDVLFVVVADHGESLGEHGEFGHGFLLHESTLHVPFLVAGPGVPAGVRREEPVSLVDVEPTLVALCGLKHGKSPRDGVVLPWAAAPPAHRYLYSETLRPLISYEWSELTAMVHDGDKIIRSREGVETYDLDADPEETRDLGTVAATAQLLGALNGVCAGDDPETVFAASRNAVDPARKELLESLGYVGGTASTASARARPHPRTQLEGWVHQQWAKKFLREALDRFEQGNLGLAETILDSTLVLNPDLADAWYLRGRVREEAGRDRDADADYEEALRRDPENVRSLSALAVSAEQAREKEEARDLWERVRAADPENEGALRFLSGWNLDHGDVEDAITQLETLTRIAPDDPAVRFNLGLACQRAGKTDAAVENFEEFVRLKPSDPRVPDIEAWLRTAPRDGAN